MDADVISWLLDSDPAIRWQAMQDLTASGAEEVAKERARVAYEGWGHRLLGLQAEDGQWGGGSYSPKWTSTTYTLLLLRHLGVDPAAPPVSKAIRLVHNKVRLGRAGQPFFSYRSELCITGMSLALASYFGIRGPETERTVEWVLERQKGDGGWNCDVPSPRSSFNTTITMLEALHQFESAHPPGPVAEARERAHEMLLERQMMRSLRTGELIKTRWTLFSFPPRWHYDVLRGLDYLREAGTTPDPRCEEAIALVESKRTRTGTWPLQNHHRGLEHFSMEPGPGRPSRWNTLRALRVLARYHRSSDSARAGRPLTDPVLKT